MLAKNMQRAVTHGLRACSRAALGTKTIASTTTRVAFVRHTFLIAPSYKARLAVRGYATATATKKTTAKKPAAKKTAPRASKAAGGKKTAAKAKAKPKKVAVKKPVKKVKKEVDPEKKALLLKRELKKKALINAEPKQLPIAPWVLFLNDHIKGSKVPEGTFGDRIKEVQALFKNASSSEIARLQERCDENKITNAANYKRWVESHSISDIATANLARARLIRQFEVKINPHRITDDRMPKRPLSSFGHFFKSRSTGTDRPARDLMKSVAAEWKSLSASDKKPYEDLHAAELTRYQKEMDRITV